MRASHPQGRPLPVQRVLNAVHRFVSPHTDEEVWANACTCCARAVQSGDVFFAITPDTYGELDDTLFLANGAYYRCTTTPVTVESLEESVSIAVLRGCKAVVANHHLPDVTVPTFVVPNVRESFGMFCHALYENPAETMKILGVAGTGGKTSTTYLIAGMLSEAGNRVGLIGTLGIFDGFQMHPTRDTTLPASELAFWLAQMRDHGCTHVVLELASDAIAQYRLAGVQLDAICLTNILRNHRSRHKTVESYRRTMLSLFRYLKPEGITVCNADDPVTAAILPFIESPVLTFGMKNDCEISAAMVDRNRGDQTFLVSAGSDVVPVRSRLIGQMPIYNALATMTLAIGLNIDLMTAARGVERVETIPGRFERIDCGQPFAVFLDCAQSPDTIATNLKTLRSVVSGRIFCILGVTSGVDDGGRPLFGRVCESHSDIVVLTSAEQESKLDKMAAEKILSGCQRPHQTHTIRDRAEAIAWVLSNTAPEDGVLIIGQGKSEHQVVESKKLGTKPPFCDRGFVKKWLYEQQPCGSLATYS